MWHQQERWSHRLLAEQELMRSRFPRFALIESHGGGLRWVGMIQPVAGRNFIVSVRYPDNYPYLPPTLFVEKPALRPGAPHRYVDGSICVHKDRWEPATGTAASCVPLAAAWLTAYLAWLAGEGAY